MISKRVARKQIIDQKHFHCRWRWLDNNSNSFLLVLYILPTIHMNIFPPKTYHCMLLYVGRSRCVESWEMDIDDEDSCVGPWWWPVWNRWSSLSSGHGHGDPWCVRDRFESYIRILCYLLKYSVIVFYLFCVDYKGGYTAEQHCVLLISIEWNTSICKEMSTVQCHAKLGITCIRN